jgi:RimJ/RimL family protein N-acetyltransferase
VDPESPTERLLLRQWRPSDRAPFAALNADPEVMRHFPSTLTREQSDAMVDRIVEWWTIEGFGLYAVEVVGGTPFIGFIGLARVRFEVPWSGAVEIGWRLAQDAWGKGYATEGARAVLDAAFAPGGLAEVVSLTSTNNLRSQAVMLRLGMHRDPTEDFDHPRVPPGPVRRHVLYRLRREEWA